MTPEPRNVTLLDNTWHLCTVPPLIEIYVKLYKMIWNICVDETSLSSTPKTNVLFVLLPFTIFTAGSTTTLFQHVLHIFLVGYLSHLLWLARSGRPSLRSLDGNVLPVGETWLTVENPSGGCLYAADSAPALRQKCLDGRVKLEWKLSEFQPGKTTSLFIYRCCESCRQGFVFQGA